MRVPGRASRMAYWKSGETVQDSHSSEQKQYSHSSEEGALLPGSSANVTSASSRNRQFRQAAGSGGLAGRDASATREHSGHHDAPGFSDEVGAPDPSSDDLVDHESLRMAWTRKDDFASRKRGGVGGSEFIGYRRQRIRAKRSIVWRGVVWDSMYY